MLQGDVSEQVEPCRWLRECCSAIGVNHSFGRHRSKNGTQLLKYANRLTHGGISLPHNIYNALHNKKMCLYR